MVPSLESRIGDVDALIGALFNHNVQAVVIRYGFPLRSRHNLEILQRYLSRIGDVDLGRLDAPELDLVGEVVRQILGAVIHPQGQPPSRTATVNTRTPSTSRPRTMAPPWRSSWPICASSSTSTW